MEKVATLYTAQEVEELLGRRYFYRQGIYRLAEEGKISSYQVNGTLYFSSQEVVLAILKRLVERIGNRYPWLNSNRLRVRFDAREGQEIIIYGFPDEAKIIANTKQETEEDLLEKIEKIREEVKKMPDIPLRPPHDHDHPHEDQHHEDHPHPHGEHKPPPPPHHREMMEILGRIEERLSRIEEKIG